MTTSNSRRPPGGPWPSPASLELRHLRSFVVLAQHRHFGRAAVRLHLSQPALSRQIAKLERVIGFPLLQRSARSIELSPAGHVLLEYARTIIADVDRAVSSSRSAADYQSDRVVEFAKSLLDTLQSQQDLDSLRAAYESVMAALPLPQDIAVRPMPAGGEPGLIIASEPMITTGIRPSVLYLHGGGYVLGSAYGHRPLVGALATVLDRTVLVSDYRLAPEHPYPAALDDALAAYRWLLDTPTPQNLVVIGDSAGAGLALSLMLRARQLELPMPNCAVLLCPWIDPIPSLTKEDSSTDATRCAYEFTSSYGHLIDLDAAHNNPLNCDLSGLPPILIQAGDADPTTWQAEQLASRLAAQSHRVVLQKFPAETHVFHHFWSFLTSAVDALDHIGRFIADPDAAH